METLSSVDGILGYVNVNLPDLDKLNYWLFGSEDKKLGFE